MKKLFALTVFFLFFIFCFLFPQRIKAAENFSVANDITYTVSDNGNTHAVFSIALTNTTSQFYASSYKIKMGFDNIKNVIVKDTQGAIQPTVTKTQDGYDVEVTFNKPVVGIGNTLTFTIAFDTPDIAQNSGKVWEVNIPGVTNQNDFSNFNVHVRVPLSFGDPSYIKPQFTKTLTAQNLDFSKEELQKAGISIGFGNNQTYAFSLSYHLKNKNLFPVKTEIALPPSTNYQDVVIDTISPKPSQVTKDADGNWLAQYLLLPGELKNVVVKGKTDIFLYPKQQAESQESLARYTQELPYWQTKNESIKKLANDLKTPYAIYEYVVKSLTYDFSRVSQSKSRIGALEILQKPSSAVCLEFTDLFVTLARAAGIPAREVDGFAFTENSKQRPLSKVLDILHAWPEYYDRQLQSWIMVDPTWGNTTGGVDYFNMLDFDHIAFVIKGVSSNYPVPAGGYKVSGNENSKDVEVFFAKEEVKLTQLFELKDSFPAFVQSGLPIESTITLKNTGNSLLGSQIVTVESTTLSPKNQRLTFKEIPPFGYGELPVIFEKTPFLTNRTDSITIRVAGKSFTSSVKISPLVLNKNNLLILGGVLGAGIFIIFISIASLRTWRVSVSQQEKGSFVRGKGKEPQK